MKHEEYEHLKSKVEKKSFFEEYKSMKNAGYYLSLILQGVLIFFGYFFFKDAYSKITEEASGFTNILVNGGAIFTITVFEIVKRLVYSKFSKDFVNDKYTFKAKSSAILFFVSLVLVVGSFFFSISGAKELSSKEKVMVTETKSDIKVYTDSLNKVYNEKITKLETQNEQLFNVNITIQSKIDELPQWSKERNSYRTQITGNKETIKNNEVQIKEYKSELEKAITTYETSQNIELTENKEENSGIIWIFIIGSIVVEIFVSAGVFFTFVYETKSIEEYELKQTENPQYKTWEFQDKVLDLIFTFKNLKKGGNLPPLKNIEDLAKTQRFIISKTQLTTVLKIFAHLEILNIKGSKKQLITEEHEARKILKDHYKIG